MATADEEATLRAAVEAAERAHAAAPDAGDAALELARALIDLGEVVGDTGSGEQGLALFQRAAELVEPLQASHTGQPDIAGVLVDALNGLQRCQTATGDESQQEALVGRLLQAAAPLRETEALSPEAGRCVAVATLRHGDLLTGRGDSAAATRALEDAARICEPFYDSVAPGEPLGSICAVALVALAGSRKTAHQDDEARELCDRAISLAERLRVGQADSLDATVDLARSLIAAGMVRRQSQPAEAEPLLRRALSLGEEAHAAYPTRFESAHQLAGALLQLGMLEEERRRFADSGALLERALAVLVPWQEARPRDPAVLLLIAGIRSQQTIAAQLKGDHEAAATAARQAAEAGEAMWGRDYARQLRGRIYAQLALSRGFTEIALGRLPAAVSEFRNAVDVADRLLAAAPESPETAASVAVTRLRLAWFLTQTGDFDMAEETLDTLVERVGPIARGHPDEAEVLVSLADAHLQRAALMGRRRAGVRSMDELQQALEVGELLREHHPERSQGHAIAGMALTMLDRDPEGAPLLRQALELDPGNQMARQMLERTPWARLWGWVRRCVRGWGRR